MTAKTAKTGQFHRYQRICAAIALTLVSTFAAVGVSSAPASAAVQWGQLQLQSRITCTAPYVSSVPTYGNNTGWFSTYASAVDAGDHAYNVWVRFAEQTWNGKAWSVPWYTEWQQILENKTPLFGVSGYSKNSTGLYHSFVAYYYWQDTRYPGKEFRASERPSYLQGSIAANPGLYESSTCFY